MKQIKQALRKTWIYPVKKFLDNYNPTNLYRYRKAIKFYSQFLQPGDLCFDVGANIGNRTDIFLDIGAKVACIEPQDICLNILKRKFSNNQNVILIDKAVGDYEGYADLSICEDASTISTLSEKWIQESRFSNEFQWTRKQSVEITKLDTLINLYGLPKFCKIDVEGFELSVIKGLNQPIPYISFEFSREVLEDTKKCINHLQEIGKVELNFSIGESMELFLSQWVTPNKLYEEFNKLSDKLLWGDVYAKFTKSKSDFISN
ncbi:MAG: FkbM family methyltransferase [Cyanobacteria bacterium J06633_8]